ncbi:MAG: YkgJ family cysteine cluster protein [Candidatus Eisenbacteria bacterium]|nr:YkgJ family cysteine cluster protein [Candidatus Eisenbacteria bacterium]
MLDGKKLRFRCTACGRCCRRPGWVCFTDADLRRAARFVGVPVHRFRERHIDEKNGEGFWIRVTRRRPCPFFRGGVCTIHEARPEQCRSFPFWPEILASREAWNRRARTCPGMEPV